MATEKLKLGIVGLVHGHVHRVLDGEADKHFEITGIAEPNNALCKRMLKKYGRDVPTFSAPEEMVKTLELDAVAVYTSTDAHRSIVDLCAIMDIPITLEKPLATTVEDAQSIQEAVEMGGVDVLTNYETSWYPSLHYLARLLDDPEFGELKKLVFRTGHAGPVKIGVDPEFLEWLTSPSRNGGGALFDFGCYGANIATWLIDDAPTSVQCVTRNLQPENYPDVDDEATIVISYPRHQVIIQASWNWPDSKKEMSAYCQNGSVHLDNETYLRVQQGAQPQRNIVVPRDSTQPQNVYDLLERQIHDSTSIDGTTAAVDNNMRVVAILDAARRSSILGSSVLLQSD